jgi:hypothetical protein
MCRDSFSEAICMPQVIPDLFVYEKARNQKLSTAEINLLCFLGIVSLLPFIKSIFNKTVHSFAAQKDYYTLDVLCTC